MDGWMDGWMTCDFTSFSTVFQSYQDDIWMIMKGCVQWNSGRHIELINCHCKQLYSHGAATRNWQTFLGDASCLFLSLCFSRLTHYPKYVFSLNG